MKKLIIAAEGPNKSKKIAGQPIELAYDAMMGVLRKFCDPSEFKNLNIEKDYMRMLAKFTAGFDMYLDIVVRTNMTARVMRRLYSTHPDSIFLSYDFARAISKLLKAVEGAGFTILTDYSDLY